MLPPNRRFKLKPAARGDLEAIWAYTRQNWGLAPAEAYVTRLSERMAFAGVNPDHFPLEKALKPALRIAFAESYVILFRETADGIKVIRIRHQREDWRG